VWMNVAESFTLERDRLTKIKKAHKLNGLRMFAVDQNQDAIAIIKGGKRRANKLAKKKGGHRN